MLPAEAVEQAVINRVPARFRELNERSVPARPPAGGRGTGRRAVLASGVARESHAPLLRQHLEEEEVTVTQIVIGDAPLTIDDVVAVARGRGRRSVLGAAARERIEAAPTT